MVLNPRYVARFLTRFGVPTLPNVEKLPMLSTLMDLQHPPAPAQISSATVGYMCFLTWLPDQSEGKALLPSSFCILSAPVKIRGL